MRAVYQTVHAVVEAPMNRYVYMTLVTIMIASNQMRAADGVSEGSEHKKLEKLSISPRSGQQIVLLESEKKESASSPEIKSLGDVPLRCLAYVRQLLQQPVFAGKHNFKGPVRILPMDSSNMTLVIAQLHQAARSKLEDQIFSIYSLDCDSNRAYGENGARIMHGIVVEDAQVESKEAIEKQLEFLNATYCTLVKQIKCNWRRASAKNYPLAYWKKDPEKWYFFMKPEQSFPEESSLMQHVAGLLNVEWDMECSNLWTGSQKVGRTQICCVYKADTSYWLIRRAVFQKIARLFELPIDAQSLQSPAPAGPR